MTETRDNRPICGVCVAFREIRPRMFAVGARRWQCPVCSCVTTTPTDPDQTAKDVQVMFAEGADETRRRQEQAERAMLAKPRVFEAGPIELTGGSKSGRKAPKKQPFRAYLVDREAFEGSRG